ncbi:hypothetical protein SDC9_57854 [bioreactor metagenome]|uniref:Uncharacterized protein n=1 Tax=bioreactor metagenome TaxID=1076179 RepID=A0A644X6R7_9ZZZZ
MSGEDIELGEALARHIVDGARDTALAVKIRCDRALIVIVVIAVVGDINLIVADILAPVSGNDDDTVVGYGFARILLGKIGVHHGVLAHDLDLVAEAFVS